MIRIFRIKNLYFIKPKEVKIRSIEEKINRNYKYIDETLIPFLKGESPITANILNNYINYLNLEKEYLRETNKICCKEFKKELDTILDAGMFKNYIDVINHLQDNINDFRLQIQRQQYKKDKLYNHLENIRYLKDASNKLSNIEKRRDLNFDLLKVANDNKNKELLEVEIKEIKRDNNKINFYKSILKDDLEEFLKRFKIEIEK